MKGINLLSKITPAVGVAKAAIAGEGGVIVAASIAAVVAGATAATVLRDVYGVPQRRRHKKKKVPQDSVPNPEDNDNDNVEGDFTDALDDDIDPSDSV